MTQRWLSFGTPLSLAAIGIAALAATSCATADTARAPQRHMVRPHQGPPVHAAKQDAGRQQLHNGTFALYQGWSDPVGWVWVNEDWTVEYWVLVDGDYTYPGEGWPLGFIDFDWLDLEPLHDLDGRTNHPPVNKSASYTIEEFENWIVTDTLHSGYRPGMVLKKWEHEVTYSGTRSTARSGAGQD